MTIIFIIVAVCIICERLFLLSCEFKKNQSIKASKTINSQNNDDWFQNEINRQQQQLAVDESIRHNQSMMDEMNNQQNQWAMDESQKSVTPFEMGGYDMNQGNSLNNNFNNF